MIELRKVKEFRLNELEKFLVKLVENLQKLQNPRLMKARRQYIISLNEPTPQNTIQDEMKNHTFKQENPFDARLFDQVRIAKKETDYYGKVWYYVTCLRVMDRKKLEVKRRYTHFDELYQSLCIA